jgi:hypothetical protein
VVVHPRPDGLETVYLAIGEPSAFEPVQLTVMVWLPGLAVTLEGAVGTAIGTIPFEVAEGEPVPAAFVAVTTKE